MEEEKKPEGRPTKYDPKYCEMLINHYAQGGTFESFGGVIEVVKQTLYNWTEQHPEFLDAKRIGVQKHLNKMLNIAHEHMVHSFQGERLDHQTWKFMMKNIHGWKDRKETEHTGNSGVAVQLAYNLEDKKAE